MRRPFYYMEANTATMLKQLNVSYDVPDLEIEERVRRIEKQTGMELDEHQMTAVKEAVRNGLLIITGGPGTGKTTTINTIIKYFEMEGLDIFLAAPTGRAAKRMSETTGFEARTIHRMLELNGGVDGAAGFERNEQNPLETDVVIIDEMSMVDISLMRALLKGGCCWNETDSGRRCQSAAECGTGKCSTGHYSLARVQCGHADEDFPPGIHE